MTFEHIPDLDPALNLEASSHRTEKFSVSGGVGEGGRNDANFYEALRVRKAGGDHQAVLNAVSALNRTHSPPQSDIEVEGIVQRVVAKLVPREKQEQVKERRRWPLVWAEDADGKRGAEYVVDDLIHAGTVGMIYGPSGSLKTMLVLDIAAHVAQGIPWCGLTTKPRGTILIAAEGGGAIEKRIHALRLEHATLPARSIVTVTKSVQLLDARALNDFGCQLIEEILPVLSVPVGLIAFDTYSQSTVGGQENGEEHFAAAENNIRELVARLAEHQAGVHPAGCLVHHPGKDETRGARGTSAIGCNLDWMLRTEIGSTDRTIQMEDRTFGFTAEKVKDGPDGKCFTYRGAIVQVATRAEDKKPIRAPVVRGAESREFHNSKKEKTAYKPKPGSWPWQVYEALAAIRARDGARDVPESIVEESGYRAQCATAPPPHEVEGYPRDKVVAFLDSKFEYESETPRHSARQPSDTPSGAYRTNRNRGITQLESKGVIRVYGDWIWLEHQ